MFRKGQIPETQRSVSPEAPARVQVFVKLNPQQAWLKRIELACLDMAARDVLVCDLPLYV